LPLWNKYKCSSYFIYYLQQIITAKNRNLLKTFSNLYYFLFGFNFFFQSSRKVQCIFFFYNNLLQFTSLNRTPSGKLKLFHWVKCDNAQNIFKIFFLYIYVTIKQKTVLIRSNSEIITIVIKLSMNKLKQIK